MVGLSPLVTMPRNCIIALEFATTEQAQGPAANHEEGGASQNPRVSLPLVSVNAEESELRALPLLPTGREAATEAPRSSLIVSSRLTGEKN